MSKYNSAIWIAEEVHAEIKSIAALQKRHMSDLTNEILSEFLERIATGLIVMEADEK